MQQNIHPTYFSDAMVTCACGNTFTTGSTRQSIKVDVCSKCHPFYTGEQRFLDRQGRVEKFQKKQEAAKVFQATVKSKKATKKTKDEKQGKTLRELLGEI